MKMRRTLTLVLAAAAIAGLLRLFVFEGIYVATASMEPTLPVGTYLVLDKITYRLRRPQKGEIVLIKSPVPPEKEMIKRVIAIGSDSVEIRDKKVILNGAVLEEPYVQHTRARERLVGDNIGPLDVPEGRLFVLGDNRDESNDSSVWKDFKTGEPVYFVSYSSVRGLLRGAP